MTEILIVPDKKSRPAPLEKKVEEPNQEIFDDVELEELVEQHQAPVDTKEEEPEIEIEPMTEVLIIPEKKSKQAPSEKKLEAKKEAEQEIVQDVGLDAAVEQHQTPAKTSASTATDKIQFEIVPSDLQVREGEPVKLVCKLKGLYKIFHNYVHNFN